MGTGGVRGARGEPGMEVQRMVATGAVWQGERRVVRNPRNNIQ